MSENEGLPEATRALVARYQTGDPAAGEEVFARYYPRVRRMVRVRLRSRGLDPADLEDLIQETFLAAALSIREFRPAGEGGFIQWLARIAENKCIDSGRRRRAAKRDREREVAFGDLASDGRSSAGWQPPADSTAVPERAARKEALGTVDECLAELEGDYREVILLRLVAGASWELVARELGRPSADAAIKLYARARTALAARMRRHGLEP